MSDVQNTGAADEPPGVGDGEADYAPDALWLEAPGLTRVGGGYVKVNGASMRKEVVWKGTQNGKWLCINKDNKWCVASSRIDAIAGTDCGLVAEEEGHMPHQIELWCVDGVVDTTVHITANPSREVTINQLILFLMNDDQKGKHYKHLPYYLVFIIGITVSACLLPSGLTDPDHNTMHWLEGGVESRMASATLLEIDSEDNMWDWLRHITNTVWQNSRIYSVPPSRTYLNRTEVLTPGPILTTVQISSWDTCKLLCDQLTTCNSFTFSPDCSICNLHATCITDATPSSLPNTTCSLITSFTFCPDNSSSPGFTMSCEENGLSGVECRQTGNTIVTPTRDSRSNYALGYVTLRQWRVDNTSCESTPEVLTVHERAKLPRDCSGRYTTSSASDTDYGPLPWRADGNIEYPLRGPSVRTPITHFDDYDERFTTALPLWLEVDSALGMLDFMRSNQWVDSQTRLISADTVMYSPSSGGYFVMCSGWVEFLETGLVKPGITTYPFAVLNFNRLQFRVSFVFDIIVTFSAAVLLVSAVRTLIYRRRITKAAKLEEGPSALGMWEFFELLHLLALGVMLYFKWWLWDRGFKMSSSSFFDDYRDDTGGDEEKLMWNWLVGYAQCYDWALVYISLAIVISFLRLFKYAQFNMRLNALSETVRGAFSDLIGMTFIFCVVIFAYAVGGTMMYGTKMHQFRVWLASASYLIRLLFTADLDKWEEMRDMRPDWTWLFLLSYFLISWLVVLNMVLAIIAGSFAVVQESLKKKSSWRLRRLEKDVVKFVKRFFTPNKGETTGAKNGSVGGGVLYAVKEVIGGRDPHGERSIALIKFVRAWASEHQAEMKRRRPDLTAQALDDNRTYISALDFRELCLKVTPPLTATKEIDRLFTFAQNQVVAGENSRSREADRKIVLISDRLATVEAQMRQQQNEARANDEQQRAMLQGMQQLLAEMSGKLNRLGQGQGHNVYNQFHQHGGPGSPGSPGTPRGMMGEESCWPFTSPGSPRHAGRPTMAGPGQAGRPTVAAPVQPESAFEAEEQDTSRDKSPTRNRAANTAYTAYNPLPAPPQPNFRRTSMSRPNPPAHMGRGQPRDIRHEPYIAALRKPETAPAYVDA